MKDRDKLENIHGEAGDSIVDRLLLRYLSSRVSRVQQNNTVLTHLIMKNSLSKSLNEFRHFPGILPLVYEPSHRAFCQQFPRSLLDFLQYTAKDVDKGRRD